MNIDALKADPERTWDILTQPQRFALTIILQVGAKLSGRRKVVFATRDIGGAPGIAGVSCNGVEATIFDDDIEASIARLLALAEVPVVRG